MSAKKFIRYMIFGSFCYLGVLLLVNPKYYFEYIIGINIPLLVGILTVYVGDRIHKQNPKSLPKFFISFFMMKLIFYGVFFALFFKFYSFSHLPFVLTFASCFIMLHISEAFFFNISFKEKPFNQ